MAPEIDPDVTGREIDRVTRHELDALEPSNAERVSKHLVMAARYVDEDPEFALEHANAAVRTAGRIGVVREAAGVAAYAAGDYALALKELRTHRRISGSQEHLPMMVDAQRALGRAGKAMEEATSEAAASLDTEAKVELAMVISGMHADAGDPEAALAALEIPQLDKNRGFSYSPKLFRAYAEALRTVGRDKESMTWERQAIVAEAALGMGQFSEPEIVDLGDDLDEDEAARTVREAQKRHSAGAPGESDDLESAGSSDMTTGDDDAAAETAAAEDVLTPDEGVDAPGGERANDEDSATAAPSRDTPPADDAREDAAHSDSAVTVDGRPVEDGTVVAATDADRPGAPEAGRAEETAAHGSAAPGPEAVAVQDADGFHAHIAGSAEATEATHGDSAAAQHPERADD